MWHPCSWVTSNLYGPGLAASACPTQAIDTKKARRQKSSKRKEGHKHLGLLLDMGKKEDWFWNRKGHQGFDPFRDGPNTTTTIISKKSFASDVTPKRHLMAHQMKNLCGFSVFHCVEGAFGASSGGTPTMKKGAPRDELKNGCGRSWAVPYPCSCVCV